MAIPVAASPFELFESWYNEALGCKAIEEPTAMTLATVDAEGRPDARIVLLKGWDTDGFVFYTNMHSIKAHQLEANPHVAMCFHWMPLEKQIRIQGQVTPVSDKEADEYFHSRPRQSQLGAWASRQSEVLPSRFALEKRLAKYTVKYPLGTIPRPPFWSGYRVHPDRIEFWLKQPFRLHDRLEYRLEDSEWRSQRLYP